MRPRERQETWEQDLCTLSRNKESPLSCDLPSPSPKMADLPLIPILGPFGGN